MDRSSPFQNQTKRKHSALFYDTSQERLQLLADYFQSGLANEELCILITPSTPKKVVQEFRTVGLDVRPHIKRDRFRIFNMLSTYIPSGHFVSNYIMNNIISYIADAETSGYHGVRIAGEMNWLNDHPDANDKAIRYETELNNLPLTYPTSILCLFSMRGMSASLAKDILNQHPSFVYDSRQHDNPNYESPEASRAPKARNGTKKTNSSRTTETVEAHQAIKKLLASLKKETDRSGTPYK